MKSLKEKIQLELATYEDGMVSAEDCIQQIITVCDNYGWIMIEDGKPIEGRWYDTYTYCREGDRTVRELYYAGLDFYGDARWLSSGSSCEDWKYMVTHYRERPAGPSEEEVI